MLYKLTLTPLTPIHVGSGDTIEPYEYVITNNLYKFQPEKFLMLLDQYEQDKFLQLSLSDIVGMRRFVRDRSKLIHEIEEYSSTVGPAVLQVYEQRLGNPQSDLSIFPFIRSGKSPYIPGSSLKGAIRTALLYEQVRKPVVESDARKLEAETFGYARYREDMYQGFDVANDAFKNLKISDSQKVNSATIFRLITVHTKKGDQWRADIPIIKEVTTSLLSENSNIAFFHTLQIVEDRSTILRTLSIEVERIIHACRSFYSMHLKEERKYLNSLPQTSKWYGELQQRADSLSDNAFLVRFGGGAGFSGVTINYARSSRETKRSRKLLEDMLPLGWAEVRIEEKR